MICLKSKASNTEQQPAVWDPASRSTWRQAQTSCIDLSLNQYQISDENLLLRKNVGNPWEKRLLTSSQSSLPCVVWMHICYIEVQTSETLWKIIKWGFFGPHSTVGACWYLSLFLDLTASRVIIFCQPHRARENDIWLSHIRTT